MAKPVPEDDLSIDPLWTVRILEEFIRSEVGRTGLKRVVIGLSGGLDSTVSAYLAARALGPEAVHGILMPHRASSEESVRDAGTVVEALGIRSETVEISAQSP
jgi:NAD+ synthase